MTLYLGQQVTASVIEPVRSVAGLGETLRAVGGGSGRSTTPRRNRATVEAWTAEQDGLIRWTLPAGGVCGFPRLEVPDVEAFCRHLAREHRVMLVPGTCFGTPGHARLGFGGPAEALELGLCRLAGALRTAALPALV